MVEDRLFIDGKWITPQSRESLPVLDATTEQEIGRAPVGNVADVDHAVRAAARAWPEWAALPVSERAAYLDHVAEFLEKDLDELVRLQSREVGTVISTAAWCQQTSIEQIRYPAKIARSYDWASELATATVEREPIGVVAAIVPWNVPLMMVAKMGPALAAGCTMVLKSAENAPLTAFFLARAVGAAGLPPGVFNLISGDGATTGEALVAHELVDMVSFTGSTRAGRRISAVAGQTIKRVSLELGASRPVWRWTTRTLRRRSTPRCRRAPATTARGAPT
jgi:aldehyde dehydrogenase (NAD+)